MRNRDGFAFLRDEVFPQGMTPNNPSSIGPLLRNTNHQAEPA
jgi:hypothetical protein